jgi:uncharacterized membrane protein
LDSPLLAGSALAASAGLNAYVPLLVLAIAGRASDKIDLVRPYGFLGSTLSIFIILTLLTIEIVVDKIPRIDYINDLIQSVVRPASGALVLMAITRAENPVNPLVAMLIGLILGATVHVYKMTSRPAITAATNGLGNPFVSMVEDGLSAVTSILAVLLPILGLISMVLSGVLLRLTYRAALKFGGARIGAKPATLRQ